MYFVCVYVFIYIYDYLYIYVCVCVMSSDVKLASPRGLELGCAAMAGCGWPVVRSNGTW